MTNTQSSTTAVVRAMTTDMLAELMGLNPDQRLILAANVSSAGQVRARVSARYVTELDEDGDVEVHFIGPAEICIESADNEFLGSFEIMPAWSYHTSGPDVHDLVQHVDEAIEDAAGSEGLTLSHAGLGNDSSGMVWSTYYDLASGEAAELASEEASATNYRMPKWLLTKLRDNPMALDSLRQHRT